MIEGAESVRIAEGVNKGKREVAKNLMEMSMDYVAVAKATGLSEDEIS